MTDAQEVMDVSDERNDPNDEGKIEETVKALG